MTPITDEQIAALVEAAKVATPGEWKLMAHKWGDSVVTDDHTTICDDTAYENTAPTVNDMAFMVAAQPTTILALAARVRADGEAMREACDLLAERIHGNPARSAGHNARLCLESALKAASPPVSGEPS